VVEFALIIPIFLLLVSGMIDFGVGLNNYMNVISATRDGARMGSNLCGTASPPCSAVITNRVTAAAAAAGISSGLSVSAPTCKTSTGGATTCDSGGAKAGGSVTITVTYTYHTIWPLAFGATIPMTYTAKFVVL
jgi:Flp pilus assembly protein TadG